MNEVNIALWKQANQVYTRLMDLTVSDALSQLNDMGELDDEVKSLVLALISSGNQPSRYFNQQISDPFQQTPWAQIDLQPGDVVGEYELLDELGQGGMASVFKAQRQDASSQKAVAIKIFNRSELSPVLLNRFAVEQEILAGLSHPNIVNMHHGGTEDNGAPYIVMDLIDQAKDIDAYCQEHQSSLRQKVHFIVAAAQAIAYAHHNLIVHRDIKPSNLLIDANRQLKVVDFGIAKLMTREDAPQKTTIMALTPSFAAPEQINSGQISVTTDVFSLAAVLLSLIIDELPLPSDRLLKSCADDEAHIWRLLKTHIKDKDLRNILHQALQQAPDQRYRNMDAFADDLNAWLSNEPVQATQTSWFYRVQKFAQRRRALFGTMVALAATMVLSVGVLTWQYNKITKEAQKALEVKNFMLDVFTVTHPDVSQGEVVSARDLLQKARVDIDAAHQSDPELKADLLLAIGTAQYKVGDWEQAAPTIAEAYALEPDNQAVVLAYAEVLVALRQADDVNQLLAEHPQLFPQQAMQNNDPRSLRILAAAELFENDFDAAQAMLERARAIDLEQANYPSLIEDTTELVKLAYQRSEYPQGIELAEQTIADYAQYFPAANTLMLRLKNELSVLYTKSGQFEKSQQLLEQMMGLQQDYLGEKHPDLLQTMISLSESYNSQGQLDLAEDMSTQVHELTIEKFGASHPKLIESYNSLATVVFIQGKYQEALDMMGEAIKISEQSFGEAHADTLKLKRNYATALGALNRNEEAKDILLQVLRQQQETLGEKHIDTLYTQITVVRVLGGLGDHDEAVSLAESAVKIIDDEQDLGGPIQSNAMFALGFAYFEASRFEQAISTFRTIETEGLEADNTANFMVMCKTLGRSYMAIEDWEQAAVYMKKSIDLSSQLVGPENIRTAKVRLYLADIYVSAKQVEQANRELAAVKAMVTGNEHRDSERMLARVDELLALNQGQ